MLSQMSILILCCVWHAIVSQLNNNDDDGGSSSDDNDTAEFADNIALSVLGGLFLLLQISFFIYWRVTVCTVIQHNINRLYHSIKYEFTFCFRSS